MAYEHHNDFFSNMETALIQTAHFHAMQERLLHCILGASQQVIDQHCSAQQNHIRVLHQDPDLSKFDQACLDNLSDDYESVKSTPAETLGEIDVVFNGVETIDRDLLQLIKGNLPQIQREESKNAALAVELAHKKQHEQHLEMGLSALLIVGGSLLTVLTAGFGATEGVGLIIEGLNGLEELVHPEKKHKTSSFQVAQFPEFKVNPALFDQVAEISEQKRKLLNTSWLHLIDGHCKKQEEALKKLKQEVNEVNEVNDVRMAGAISSYERFSSDITSIKQIAEEAEKTQAIRQLAGRIQAADRVATKVLKVAYAALPVPEQKVADGFFNRAKDFYRQNKTMIRIAALIAVSAAAIALTVATGGAAAVIGVATLGALAMNPVKSVFRLSALSAFERKQSRLYAPKPSAHEIAKVVIGVGAVVALGVLTGGVGLIAAFGCAAIAWMASKAIKKVYAYQKSIEVKSVDSAPVKQIEQSH